MKVKYVSIFTIFLVLVSGIPLISGGAMNYANAKYATNSQSQANANECEVGTNCAINSPQTQGDGTANSPTNLQISRFNDEEEEQEGNGGVDGGVFDCVRPFDCAQLFVKKIVICPTGFVCPTPDKFTMKVEMGLSEFSEANPEIFPGSDVGAGTLVTLIWPLFEHDPITYTTTETAPPTPPALTLVQSATQDCVGEVKKDDVKNCVFTNEYRTLPMAEVLVKKKVICPTGFVCPTPDKFTMMVESDTEGSIVRPDASSGSETGTKFTIFMSRPSTDYTVAENLPPTPRGLNLLASQDEGCEGPITAGQSKTCTVTNEYRVR
jgi:hypothetical protein